MNAGSPLSGNGVSEGVGATVSATASATGDALGGVGVGAAMAGAATAGAATAGVVVAATGAAAVEGALDSLPQATSMRAVRPRAHARSGAESELIGRAVTIFDR